MRLCRFTSHHSNEMSSKVTWTWRNEVMWTRVIWLTTSHTVHNYCTFSLLHWKQVFHGIYIPELLFATNFSPADTSCCQSFGKWQPCDVHFLLGQCVQLHWRSVHAVSALLQIQHSIPRVIQLIISAECHNVHWAFSVHSPPYLLLCSNSVLFS